MFDKIWSAHEVATLPGDVSLLYVDRHLIHDLCDAQPAQHLPHRGDVPEGEVARAIRLARSGLREPGGDLLGRA